ncbi:hypothetical protein BY996DRAFT_6416260 [Phakopsora pachyrhizi]|nr:hypothetical protein BY996DRAFT_6416260 [Phakopsora pachyrhizi]
MTYPSLMRFFVTGCFKVNIIKEDKKRNCRMIYNSQKGLVSAIVSTVISTPAPQLAKAVNFEALLIQEDAHQPVNQSTNQRGSMILSMNTATTNLFAISSDLPQGQYSFNYEMGRISEALTESMQKFGQYSPQKTLIFGKNDKALSQAVNKITSV